MAGERYVIRAAVTEEFYNRLLARAVAENKMLNDLIIEALKERLAKEIKDL